MTAFRRCDGGLRGMGVVAMRALALARAVTVNRRWRGGRSPTVTATYGAAGRDFEGRAATLAFEQHSSHDSAFWFAL